jgi:hypothetical protein
MLLGMAPIVLALVPALLPAGEPQAAPQRVLVYTVSAGFEHDVVKRPAPDQLSLVERELVALGRESGRFEAVPSRDSAEFDPERLARYGAVLFYTTGELPLSPERQRALLDFVKNGKGFVGVHSATDTFYALPEYGEMVGGYFDGHPWHEKVRVTVEDREHAATRHLAPSFEITDEIYQQKAPYDRAKLHVLLSLDVTSIDITKPGVNRKDRDFAIAWTRDVGRGRMFYTALGHRPEVWADPRFRSHLTGGIRWALRDEPPPPKLAPEDEALRAYALQHPGDPAKGFAVFRRESGPMCIRCHHVLGEGGDVGPDLSDLGRKHTRAEILEQILAPSAEIEPGYRATTFELRDGTLLSGRVRAETPERIEVWDVDAKLHVLDPHQVAARRQSEASLMPEGLARTVSREDFADLVAWLQTLKGSG